MGSERERERENCRTGSGLACNEQLVCVCVSEYVRVFQSSDVNQAMIKATKQIAQFKSAVDYANASTMADMLMSVHSCWLHMWPCATAKEAWEKLTQVSLYKC